MDLNLIYQQHFIARAAAENATSPGDEALHRAQAEEYSRIIADARINGSAMVDA